MSCTCPKRSVTQARGSCCISAGSLLQQEEVTLVPGSGSDGLDNSQGENTAVKMQGQAAQASWLGTAARTDEAPSRKGGRSAEGPRGLPSVLVFLLEHMGVQVSPLQTTPLSDS